MQSSEENYRLQWRSREALLAGDLTDAEIDLIARTDMDPRHGPLDDGPE